MESEIKNYIQLHLRILKESMKSEGLMFGIVVDKNDPNESKLAFVGKEKYFANGEVDGISISLTDLNEGLI